MIINMIKINKYLIYYRIHNNQIGTQKNNINKIDVIEKKTFKKEIDSTPIRKGLLIKIYNNSELDNLFVKINKLKKTYHYFYFYLEKSLLNDYIENNNNINTTYILFDHDDSYNI